MSVTIRDAINYIDRLLIAPPGLIPGIDKRTDMLEQARSALVEKAERMNPQPLTLEELRQMDGEPVWVRVSTNWRESGVSEGWCIVRFHTSDDRVMVYIWDTRHGARIFAQQDLGISWWAYRHKPKEANNEA